MIREGIVRHVQDDKPLNWINHLQNYLNSRNDTKHSVTKSKPSEIWADGRDFDVKNDKAIHEMKLNSIAEARGRLTFFKNMELKKGDYVRVSNAKLYSEVRQVIKQGGQKMIPVKFSPQIYIVSTVIKPRKADGYHNYQYEVSTLYGHVLTTEVRVNQMGGKDRVREGIRFFASDLQKVDKDSEKLMTNAEGQKLNQIGINDFNEEETDAIEKENEKKKARAKELAQTRKENKKNQPPEPPRRSERIKNKVEKIEVNFNDPDQS